MISESLLVLIVQKPACGEFGFRVPCACILSIEVVQFNDHVSALTPPSTLVLLTKRAT